MCRCQARGTEQREVGGSSSAGVKLSWEAGAGVDSVLSGLSSLNGGSKRRQSG